MKLHMARTTCSKYTDLLRTYSSSCFFRESAPNNFCEVFLTPIQSMKTGRNFHHEWLEGNPMKLVADWVVFYECKTFSAHPYHLDEAPNLAKTHYFIMFRWLSKNQCEVEIRESAEKHVLETTSHSSFEQFQKYVKESSNRYRGQTLCRK